MLTRVMLAAPTRGKGHWTKDLQNMNMHGWSGDRQRAVNWSISSTGEWVSALQGVIGVVDDERSWVAFCLDKSKLETCQTKWCSKATCSKFSSLEFAFSRAWKGVCLCYLWPIWTLKTLSYTKLC